MAINLVPVECPVCGATATIDASRPKAFCSYCGTQLIINNENEHIYRNVDEAKIVQTMSNEQIRLKELELEEKERLRKHKRKLALGITAFVLMLSGIIVSYIEDWGSMAGIWLIMIGILTGLITAQT